uniref:Uncharacterized protein n=1 Tax=Trichuris muris TaxID=70415 RepID=A0A5S6QC62_TRIMR
MNISIMNDLQHNGLSRIVCDAFVKQRGSAGIAHCFAFVLTRSGTSGRRWVSLVALTVARQQSITWLIV